jgi:hypothetical protein
MALPPRVYYTLQEVTARWGCNIADVAGWAAAGKFHIMTGIGLVRCGEEIVAGRVVLSPMDLMPLFRRCGTGPTEGVVRRIMTGEKSQWQIITDPVGGVTVAVADMMIMADEVHAFEEENDMVRRVAAGPGAATPYDWEGMNIALIVRIHDHGPARHPGRAGCRDAGLVRGSVGRQEDARQPLDPAQDHADMEGAAREEGS